MCTDVNKMSNMRLDEEVGFLFYFFFVCTVEAHMIANTHNTQQGEQEARGVGEGRKKQWNRDMWRSVEGRGMEWGYTG